LQPVAAVFDVENKRVDPLLQEITYKRVLEEWQDEVKSLLNTAMSYYGTKQ
jgi:hypothetical protein